MRRILRWPIRTYVYSGILFYLTLLCIGKGVEFIWFVLKESSELTQTQAVMSGQGLWEELSLEGAFDSCRLLATTVLRPLASLLARAWPLAAAAILAYPLVALGIAALLAAIFFFMVSDLLTGLFRKMNFRQ